MPDTAEPIIQAQGLTKRFSDFTAVDAIDRELGEDAPSKGSEVCEGLRSFFAPPLKAIFSVYEDDRIAEVLRVRSL